MTKPKELVTHARVRLVVDVKVPQPWDPKTPSETVFRAAEKEAVETIRNHFSATHVSVVGSPEVFMVVAHKEGG